MHYKKTVWGILVIFFANITLSSRVIIISVLIIKPHDGVHRHKYLYHVATWHSTLIIFSVNIMSSEFHQGEFSSSCLLQNHMVAYKGANIHNVLPYHIQIYFHSLQKVCVDGNLIKGHFSLDVHQRIVC